MEPLVEDDPPVLGARSGAKRARREALLGREHDDGEALRGHESLEHRHDDGAVPGVEVARGLVGGRILGSLAERLTAAQFPWRHGQVVPGGSEGAHAQSHFMIVSRSSSVRSGGVRGMKLVEIALLMAANVTVEK